MDRQLFLLSLKSRDRGMEELSHEGRLLDTGFELSLGLACIRARRGRRSEQTEELCWRRCGADQPGRPAAARTSNRFCTDTSERHKKALIFDRTESMHPSAMFRGCRLARMSDGHYCLVRNLGLVKGGKGMKHHEVVIDFSRRGLLDLVRRGIRRIKPASRQVNSTARETAQASEREQS